MSTDKQSEAKMTDLGLWECVGCRNHVASNQVPDKCPSCGGIRFGAGGIVWVENHLTAQPGPVACERMASAITELLAAEKASHDGDDGPSPTRLDRAWKSLADSLLAAPQEAQPAPTAPAKTPDEPFRFRPPNKMAEPCEGCGGTDVVFDCPRCGAPNCCPMCCKLDDEAMQAEAEKATAPAKKAAQHNESAAALDSLALGQRVEKATGDYAFDGTVVAAFSTLAGKHRYVVEHDGTHMLHIFSLANLQPRIVSAAAAQPAPQEGTPLVVTAVARETAGTWYVDTALAGVGPVSCRCPGYGDEGEAQAADIGDVLNRARMPATKEQG